MKLLFDTSVLVAAIVEAHPHHSHALPQLQDVKSGKHEFFVAAHSLAELYAVLTSLLLKPKISPLTARRLIDENVISSANIISLSAADYKNTLKELSELALTGGIVYDALVAKAAKKSRIDRLLTFNAKDFQRVWPEGEDVIQTP